MTPQYSDYMNLQEANRGQQMASGVHHSARCLPHRRKANSNAAHRLIYF